jgi:ketosteroid isomerase-like protein
MNPNAVLLQRLFTSLDQHDHAAMADCYHREATFRDIAFDLSGKKEIHAMWHMICEGDIRTKFAIVDANNSSGRVNVVDDYTFTATGRKVHNIIDSRFQFRDGVIVKHEDFCDARQWAAMAVGGVGGFLAGRFRILRERKARKKLDAFRQQHPEYC